MEFTREPLEMVQFVEELHEVVLGGLGVVLATPFLQGHPHPARWGWPHGQRGGQKWPFFLKKIYIF
jgi:hypothetical protein